jgi:ariadne-1
MSDDEIFDNYGDGMVVDETKSALRRQVSYEIISAAELEAQTKALAREVKEILDLPNTAITMLLLRHYQWNKEKCIEAFMENPEKAKKEAGISTLALEKKPSSPTKKYECPVCWEIKEGKDTFALGCGHRYCLDCWKTYLELKLQNSADAVWTKCPHPKCKDIVHDRAFKKLVSPTLYKTYKKSLLRSLVTDNPRMKWCPNPGCTNVIRCERKNRKEAVTCSCGFSFCFKCADSEIGDHMPATCENVEMWMKKATDESENVKWLIANTKKCPNCRKPIEKNGGCMHMTCRKSSGGCGHEFCWLCRGDWKDHGAHTGGYYACNKYDASAAKKEDQKASELKTELETYMFYYHRYESHKNAMKIADEQRKNAEKKGDEILSKFAVRPQDTKFLKEATEQLIRNRRVLQWSYVYGYYLDKSKTAEKNLFEYLQEDLEKHTNHLSELYEMPLEKLEGNYQKFMQWKEDVTNYTRVTAKFLEKFVEGVMGGLTQNE